MSKLVQGESLDILRVIGGDGSNNKYANRCAVSTERLILHFMALGPEQCAEHLSSLGPPKTVNNWIGVEQLPFIEDPLVTGIQHSCYSNFPACTVRS